RPAPEEDWPSAGVGPVLRPPGISAPVRAPVVAVERHRPLSEQEAGNAGAVWRCQRQQHVQPRLPRTHLFLLRRAEATGRTRRIGRTGNAATPISSRKAPQLGLPGSLQSPA